jgi:hypothetical protein
MNMLRDLAVPAKHEKLRDASHALFALSNNFRVALSALANLPAFRGEQPDRDKLGTIGPCLLLAPERQPQGLLRCRYARW